MNDMPVFGPDQVSTKTALEDIAIETGTPIEVLFAAGEQAEAKTPEEFLNVARQRGQQLGPRFKAGEDPTAIVAEVFGPEAQRSFGDYATEIRAQLYGTPTVQQRNQASLDNEGFLDTAKRRGQQFVRGVTEPFAAMPEAAAIAQAQTDGADTPAADMEGFARGQQMRDSVADTFGAPNPEDRSFWGQVFEGAGNLVGMGGASLAAGVAGTVVGGPVGGTVAGLTTGAGIGAAMNTSQLYREARDAGADEATAERAARWGAVIGASEIVPIARAFKYLPQGVRQKIGNGVMKRFVDIAQSAGEEAAQEYLATVANNMVAQQLYDPDRGWTEGATESALVGAVLGAGAGGIGAGVDAYRNRQQPQPLPDAETGQSSVPPGANPVPGMVPPVSGRGVEPEQGVPTPTSDALRPQPVDPLDPAGQRPAAPSPVSDVLAGAPQPALGGFKPNQPVQIQLVDPETGELSDPFDATFVGEDPAQGYASFRGPDGSPAEIDLAEIASGNVIVSPAAPEAQAATQPQEQPIVPPVQEAAQQPAQPAAGAMPPIPAGVDPDAFMERVAVRQADGMSPEEAYQLTLQDTLEAMRQDVGVIADDVQERERQARKEQSRIDEAVFTDDRGQPVVFPTEAAALGRLGAGYTVEPFGGGFIGVRQQEAAGNEGNANDGMGGDGSPVDGGGNIAFGGDADRAPVADGRDGASLGSVEQSPAQGVADAARAPDADAALTAESVALEAARIRRRESEASQDPQVDPVAKQEQYLRNLARENPDQAAKIAAEFRSQPQAAADAAGVSVDRVGAYASIIERQLALSKPAPNQEPVKQNAAPEQDVTPDQPEIAPADQETDPIRAAVRDAIAAGPIQHTTAKGKVLDGYILKGMKPAQVKEAFDTGAFPKDGGTFIRKDRAEKFLGDAQAAAPSEINQKAVAKISAALKPDNKDGLGYYVSGSDSFQIDALGDGDAEITITNSKSRYEGRAKVTSENSQRVKYSDVRDSLSPEARAAIEEVLAFDPDAEAAPVSAGTPAEVDYPNRKLNMRKARVEAPIDGMGDMSDGSFGNIALSNAREGDVLPGVGTVLKVTDKQIQITQPDGNILRLSDGEKLNRLARDMGALIASSANLRDEQLGSLMDMIERDPTLTYRDGVPMLFDDPDEQANRGQRAQRGILKPLAPTRQEVEQAAAQADPNPTDGQKEAGNYRKGHLAWNGLDLTIENAKGSERSGTAPDGTKWSVTMPADYGYFKRTESADGDHVDFYMGDVPDSDYVLIINQVDPETQKMDEHKVIIGTTARGAALGIYRDGFSDGSGNSRIGSFTETNVANLKAWLASGETKTPTQPIDMPFAKRKAAAAEAGKPVPIKQIEIPAVGFLRPGYERVIVNGEPSTDQTRMTDDGYVVVRQINKTTIRGPQGQVIWSGAYDVDEATVDAEIGKARDRRAKDAPKSPTWADFDERSDNDPKMPEGYELTVIRRMTKQEAEAEGYQWPAYKAVVKRDKPAGTYKVESGISENSRANAIAVALERAKKGAERTDAPQQPQNNPAEMSADDILNAAFDDVFGAAPETAADPAPDATPPAAPAASLPESVETALSGQLEKKKARLKRLRSGNKPGVQELEAEIRKMRQQIFEAEDAAAQAIAQGDPSLFDAYAGMFPDAAEAIRDELPAPAAPRTAGQAAASAASNAAEGIGNIVDGLNALFGGPNKLSSGLTFDAETYAKAKPMFIAAVRAFGRAGQDIMDMARAMVRGLSANGLTQEAQENMRPYLTRFINDMRDGTVDPFAEDVQAPAEGANVQPEQPEATDEQRGNQEGDTGEPAPQEDGAGSGERAGNADSEPADDGSGEGYEDGEGTDAGDDAGGSLGDGPGSVSDRTGDTRAGTPPPNFVIDDAFPLGEGTEGQKLAANIEALRLVRTLEQENRYATPDEQAVLARWVGWGGLKTVFDDKHAGATTQWGRAQAALKELLTTEEYIAAMRSTNDAHYTSRTVVKAMWRAMRNFGFDGGRALEPTIGSGNFLGLQPADLSAKTEWFAAELDPTTGKIAKHLYPQARVFDGMGFQDAPFKRAAFDVAIGNPPFGATKIGNKKLHPDLGKMSVHNFIIAKTGQLLREGGVMSMVVTHRFLDTANPEARKALAPEFRFLGAIRLPNTAFEANANTQVTTDIVFFQKRREGETDNDTTWLETGVDGPNGTKLNGYFAANPDMILGRPAMDGTMYAGGRQEGGPGEFTVHADGRDLEASLNEAIDRIQATIPPREQALEAATTARENSSTLPYGAMTLTKDGRIFRGEEDEAGNRVVQEVTAESFWKDNAEAQERVVKGLRAVLAAKKGNVPLADRLDIEQRARDAAIDVGLVDLAGDPVKQNTKYETALAESLSNLLIAEKPRKDALDALTAYESRVESKRLGTDGFERLSSMLDLRQKTRELIAMERADAEPNKIEATRRRLRDAYRTFQKKYGYLNNSKNEAILRGDVGPELALELGYLPSNKEGRAETAKEAPILSKRVIYPHKLPDAVESVADGLHVSMQERGFIDPALIGQLTGKTTEEVVKEMTSGAEPLAFRNPKTGRFEIAEVYLSGNLAEKIADAENAGMYQNVPHLKNAMPPPKAQEQITPSIRSLWIPPEVFNDFLRAMGYNRPKVELFEKVGMASVDAGGTAGLTEFGKQFETERMDPARIFEHAIKGKIPVVYDTIRTPDGDKRVKNEEATREAVAAYDRMTREFPEWAYTNPERAGKIVDAFNEKMNVVTERKYQGVRYLRMVGNSPEIDLRNSQKNGAWRMIQDKVALLHHVVGAGKTFTAIAGVMERKRMGLTRKAVVAVPNHLTGQWGREWLELYPAANILVPTENDFKPANRAKLINRIATGDFDAVIVGHSQLTKIQNDPETTTKYIAEQIDELNSAMQEARASGESRRTVGQMGTRLTKLSQKLRELEEKLAERTDSKVLGWKDLGVDYLVVDEAHLFKNLEYTTTASQLVGMNAPGGSQRAFDMLMKVRTLQAMQGGGVSFLTGTPVSNSLVEIYSMMKYLIPDSLRSMGIQAFDGWKAAFIQDESRFEYTASMQLKERNIMSGMINLGPLSQLYRSFADIVMRPDVERMFTEQMEARNAAEPDPAKRVPTRFPTPKVKGGARRISLAPPTEKMKEFVRYLVMRMAGIKANKSNRDYMSVDNALWVLTDARKASVDIRTIDPTLGREEGSKVDRASAEVFRIWQENAERKGAQMVFSDMSAPTKSAEKDAKSVLKAAYEKLGLKGAALKDRMRAEEGMSYAERWGNVIEDIENLISSPDTDDRKRDGLNEFIDSEAAQDASAAMFTADTGFSFYDDMRAALIEKGVPEKEIAFIHDYDTTAKKAQLFDAVNEGNIRVLIGSTQKMGAGTNAQKRLVALHHIDAPWRPSDMEQREGRIIRQGNLFYQQDPEGFEVEIVAYSTEQTADVVQWQVLERKAASIETFLNAAADTVVEEGGDADQYAEFMAQSTGKEVFLQKMQAEKARDTARAEVASTLRNLSEAERFMRDYQGLQELYGARADTFASFSTDMIGEGADSYLSDWEATAAAYRADKERIEAEREAVRLRNSDRARKDWEKLPELPSAPARWETRPESGWERKVYDVLDRLQRAGAERSENIDLGGGFKVSVFAKASGVGIMDFRAYLVPPNNGKLNADVNLIDGWSVEVKDFRRSDKLLNALSPANIAMRAEARGIAAARDKQRHADTLPQMQAIQERGVDMSKVEEAEERLARLTALVRIEEVKFASETASAGPNYFAERDDKGRDLIADNTAQPLTGQFQFTNAGQNYASEWGAPDGTRRIEGTDRSGLVAFFEAENMDTGEKVVVEAIRTQEQAEGKPEEWSVLNVWDGAEAVAQDAPGSAMEMRGDANPPVATLTGQELGEWSDMRQLARKAEDWYRENLIGKTVVMESTGWEVQFSRAGSKKVTGRKGDIILRAIPALESIIAKSVLKSSERGNKPGTEQLTFHKVEATVEIDGQAYDLSAIVRESANGKYHYDLSLGDGFEGSSSPAAGQVSEARSSQAETPDALNLEFAPSGVNADPAFTEDARRAVTRALRDQLAKVLPGKRVSVSLVRELYSLKDGTAIMGRANRDGSVQVSEAFARDGAGAAGILNHEIVHVLRDKGLWRSEYGLFERGEWERLVRKAEADTGIVASVKERYKDKGLTREEMQEEYVAEMYRLWKGAVDGYGAVERILLKIEDFFRALASAFRGEGFDSAGRIMQRIADGGIGGRGPDGPGRGVQPSVSATVPAEMRADVRDQIKAAWDGAQPDRPIVLGRFPAVMRALTGSDKPFVVAASVIRKAGSHGLTENDVYAAIDGLDDPVMVFDSTNGTGNLTALVETAAEDGRSIVVAVDASFRVGKVEVSRIASVHGKNKDGVIVGWMRDGYLRYINKQKAGAWARSRGRQLPKDMETSHRLGIRILQHRDVFKGGAEMRLGRDRDPVVNPSVMAQVARLWSPRPAGNAAALDKKEAGFVSNLITNAMASNDRYNSLGLVPGEVLFRDLGKSLPSAAKWVKTMRQMTAERQEMHAEADVLAREWQGAYAKDKTNGRALHDLMHESTIEQVDPSERFRAPRRPVDMSDAQYMNFVEDKRAKHAELKQKFNALPDNMRDIYRKARDAYKAFDAKLIDAMVDAVVKAMGLQADRLKARYEAELQQFRDDGLEGDALKEAQRKARSRYNQDVKMLEFSRNARIRKMRLTYEANRIEGPYFPLMRFGQFFVAARNEKGKLVHFERASTAGSQQRIANEMRDQGLTVETGVMKPEDNMSRFVDPNFVADITESLGEAGADSTILDAIYQRYLETLPSFSIRKANIHRQGVPGFDKDAIKAFGNRMFHGAHQLTRLRHSMDLTKHIENARREAKRAPDPVRAGALANEMQKRHDWSMNPQGAEWSAWATSAAFVWYLGLTPAAAMINLSQTTVVGIPMLAAGIQGGTVAKASKALTGALADFTAGLKKGDAEWSRGALTSGRLSEDERRALQAAYLSGALDKSQAHDIAAIGESGAEYSPIREKVMRPIAFLFHHAERLNREVTFLAAYRMAKEAGMDYDGAVKKAGDLTWDTHFNYENWSRPRFMQGDVARVLFTFRQFQVNMLYRLFRDSHQALKGETPEVRKQARAQLIGITASMLAHAGITGTWGYALIMLLAGMFMEGGAEEAEEELKKAIVGTFGAGAGGFLLNGVPGHLTGVDLTSRIGMPELWFRSPDRQLEGKEAYNHWVEQILGPVPAIGASIFRGASMVGDGEVWRGMELMVPKAIRDQLRFVRYLNEGVTTYKGDPLLDDISAHDAIVQAIGFSPARVSERYEQNRRLMNAQTRIEDERRKILSDITRYIRDGQEISPRALRRRDEFNAKYPTFAITGETIRRSYRARLNMSEQMDGGIRINPKLDRYLRDNMAPTINN